MSHLPPHAALYSLLAAVFGLANGLIHIAADALLDETTLRALVIALATATMTGVFGVAIALIQRNSDRQTHDRLEALERRGADIAGAVGANRRDTDPDGGEKAPTAPA